MGKHFLRVKLTRWELGERGVRMRQLKVSVPYSDWLYDAGFPRKKFGCRQPPVSDETVCHSINLATEQFVKIT